MKLVKIDENQNRLEVGNRYDFLIEEMWNDARDLSKYPLLRCVDPNQDTYFNEIQITFVVEELKRLKDEISSKDSKSDIDNLVEFLTKIKMHEFAKFESD
ncbi:MAG: hypothetical protein R3B60_00960 [Candidatus Paceibacterota bacterium]